MKPAAFAALCAALVPLATTVADAAGWVRTDQVRAPNLPAGTTNVRFGSAVAADVTYGPNTVRALYVGAPYATVRFNNVDYPGAGKVFVFMRNGGHWQLADTLYPATPQNDAHFGAAVAVQNGILAVGEPDYDNSGHPDAGRVWYYVDYYSGTTLPPLINPIYTRSTLFDNAHMGRSVDVSGSGRVIGGIGTWIATGASGLAGVGCVYLTYFNDSLAFTEKGSTCGANNGDLFGASVAVRGLSNSNMNLVVGAPGEAQGGQVAAGAVHLYVLASNTLTSFGDVHAQTPAILDTFGSSVAIDSHRLYVGANGRDKTGVGRTGSVSLFTPAFIIGYDFEAEVFPSAGAKAGDLCGASLYLNSALDHGFAMGCPGSDGLVNGEGFVRVVEPIPFLNGTLWLDSVLNLGDLPHGADDVGRGVVLVADHVYAGAPLADDAVGTNNGSVEEFALDLLFANGFD